MIRVDFYKIEYDVTFSEVQVGWSLCGYCILCVSFVSFVPTRRTKGRAVPVLMLHCPLVCALLEARFVEQYWLRPQTHPGPD